MRPPTLLQHVAVWFCVHLFCAAWPGWPQPPLGTGAGAGAAVAMMARAREVMMVWNCILDDWKFGICEDRSCAWKAFGFGCFVDCGRRCWWWERMRDEQSLLIDIWASYSIAIDVIKVVDSYCAVQLCLLHFALRGALLLHSSGVEHCRSMLHSLSLDIEDFFCWRWAVPRSTMCCLILEIWKRARRRTRRRLEKSVLAFWHGGCQNVAHLASQNLIEDDPAPQEVYRCTIISYGEQLNIPKTAKVL